jgi:sulfur carrier protein
MKTILNGKSVEIGSGLSLLDLVRSYRLQVDGVIVSLNDEVVTRDSWPEVLISEGDRIELVSLVGGG